MRTRKPDRLTGFTYVGNYRYSLTFCTYQRLRLFTTSGSVDSVLAQIVRAADNQQFAVVVYCFMPDHLHLLIEGQTDESDCREFISRSKQYSGFHYAKTTGCRLWQRYGFERVLRPEETTVFIARYILNNPVRAGLVANPEDYPFLGSKTHPLTALLDAVQDGVDW